MTSNLVVYEDEKEMMTKLKSFFRPEFLNRLDEIIRFNALSKKDIRQIVDIQISQIQKRMDERHIQLVLDDKAKDWLADNGYDAEFGARPLKRLLQQELENKLALKILDGEIKDNTNVFVSVQNNALSFNVK